jgi:hypothetical protein
VVLPTPPLKLITDTFMAIVTFGYGVRIAQQLDGQLHPAATNKSQRSVADAQGDTLSSQSRSHTR